MELGRRIVYTLLPLLGVYHMGRVDAVGFGLKCGDSWGTVENVMVPDPVVFVHNSHQKCIPKTRNSYRRTSHPQPTALST